MGTGTHKQELNKIKKDIGMVLPDDTPAYTDTIVLHSTLDNKDQINEMMNVSIVDKLDNNGDKHLVVYCSTPGKEIVRYKVRITSAEIESKIAGALSLPRRRLCREIVGRLKVNENHELIIVGEDFNETDENNSQIDDAHDVEMEDDKNKVDEDVMGSENEKKNGVENDNEDSEEEYDVGEVAKEIAETVFYMLDRDGDGDVTRGEMMRAINQSQEIKRLIKRNKYLAPLLNPRAWGGTFKAIDVSSDGKINLEEFQNFAVNICLETKKREDMGEEIKLDEPVSELIFEGPYSLATGEKVEMTVKQVSAHEIEISCTFNKGFAHGIFSTKQISLTVPGWDRVWKRADNKRKVDLISAGLTIGWHIDNEAPILLMPGSSIQIMQRDDYTIDGENCKIRIVEHAGKNAKELSRLNVICIFGTKNPPCVANCNADVQTSIRCHWSETELSTEARNECLETICRSLKKLPANTFKWRLFASQRVFNCNGKNMMVNISATVAGSDPRLDKIEIEGYDKDRSNHMGCVLLKTDERRLRALCKSRRWPDFIEVMIKHLHFDGYTLAFDWDLDEAMHSTPANSPEKVAATKTLQQQSDVLDTNAAIDAKIEEKSVMIMAGNATVITKSELKEDDPAPDGSDIADAVELKVPSEVENTVPEIQIVAPLRNYSKNEEKDELVGDETKD